MDNATQKELGNIYRDLAQLRERINRSYGGVVGNVTVLEKAIKQAEFLVLTLDGDLQHERRFAPGWGLSGADGGANNNYALTVNTTDLDARYPRLNRIIRMGTTWTTYEKSTTGLTAALAAATTGEVVWCPPGTYAGDISVPAGVELRGASQALTIIAGRIATANGSRVSHLSVIYSNGAYDIGYGIKCPTTEGDTVHIDDCYIDVENLNSTATYGVWLTAIVNCYMRDTEVYARGDTPTALRLDVGDAPAPPVVTEYASPYAPVAEDTYGSDFDPGPNPTAETRWEFTTDGSAAGWTYIQVERHALVAYGGTVAATPLFTSATYKANSSVSNCNIFLDGVWKTTSAPANSLEIERQDTTAATATSLSADGTILLRIKNQGVCNIQVRAGTSKVAAVGTASAGLEWSSKMQSVHATDCIFDGAEYDIYSEPGMRPALNGCTYRKDRVYGSLQALRGDRSAWDTANYGLRHASDWIAGDSHHPRLHDAEDALNHATTATDTALVLRPDGAGAVEFASLATDLEPYKTYCGFENRTDSELTINSGTGVLALAVKAPATSFTVYIADKKIVLSAPQTVTITEDQTITYVYLDNDGVLQKSLTVWNIASNQAATGAIVFKDSGSYAVTDERHGYERNRAWHLWAHSNIGAMYKSGLTGTFATTSLSIAQGVIYDEDIRFDTGGTQTTCTLWYRNATSGMRITPGSSVAKAVSDPGGILQYDDGSGTLQDVTNNSYSTQWVYATNDATVPIYVVVGQNNNNTLTLARNATLPIINLSTAEWKLLYRVIFQRTSGTPAGEYIEATDFRQVQTGVPTSAASLTDHATTTNRDAANSHPASAIREAVTIGRVMQSNAATGDLEAAALIGPAVNVLTLTAGAAYTLDVPASGTAALLERAQTFTAANTFQNTVNSTTAFRVNNSAGTDVLSVDTTNGHVGIGTAIDARFWISNTATTKITQVLRGVTSQTANHTEWQVAGGAIRASMSYAGRLGLGIGITSATARVEIIETGPPDQLLIYSTTSDNADQYCSFASMPYTQADGKWIPFFGFASSGSNSARFGGGTSGGKAATDLKFYTAANTTTATGTLRITINNVGSVLIGTTTDSARLAVQGGADAVQFLVTGHTTQAAATPIAQITRNDAAAGVSALLGLTALGSGANGDGGAIYLRGKSSTTAGVDFARISWLANDNTHASRKYDLVLSALDTAEREGVRIRGTGSAAALGVLGATPVARQLHIADASGGATVDVEARTAINAALAVLEQFGFVATS